MGNDTSTGSRDRSYSAYKRFNQSPVSIYVDELISVVEGEVILPSDKEAYAAARTRPFNIDQQGYPLIIVRVKNVHDISSCVRFIRHRGAGIKVCVACGCHSSHCMVSESFVIDLYYMYGTHLDRSTNRITVEGGALLRDVNKALEPHNLAITLGIKPDIGIGGQVLSGGYGFLARNFGLSVDQLVEAEVVLEDGSIVIANDDNEYSDLMWALRGGGGNFGIVSKFVFQSFSLPSQCCGGTVAYFAPTFQSAKSICENFDNIVQSQRDDHDGVTGILQLTAGSLVVTTTWAYVGEKQDAITQMPQLVQGAHLGGWLRLENSLGERNYYNDLQYMLTDTQYQGHVYQSICFIGYESRWLPESCFDSLLAYTRESLSPAMLRASVSLIALGGGVIALKDDGSRTCITPAMRHARYYAVIEAYWRPGYGQVGKSEAKQWSRGLFKLLDQYKCANMTHASDEVSKAEPSPRSQINDSYKDLASEMRLAKLAILKTKYDPSNFFSENSNIVPRPASTRKHHHDDDGRSSNTSVSIVEH